MSADLSHLTVREICDLWLAKRAEDAFKGKVREVTVNGYASALHAPLIYMGDMVAHEVTADDVEGVLDTLATKGGKWGRPLSHRSIVYALGSLRQAFNHGVRKGWLKSSPAALAKPPRAQQSTEGRSAAARLRWTSTELAAFREHADAYGEGQQFALEPWLRSGMRLTLSGLRRSEVLGLDWQHVGLDDGIVEIVASRVKTGRGTATAMGGVKAERSGRTVHVETLHPGTSSALRSLWLAQGRPTTGLVICDAAGEPVAPDLYSARFRALCGEADLPVLRSIHNVRHTIATAFHADGMPDHRAASMLGHDVQTYQRFYLVNRRQGGSRSR